MKQKKLNLILNIALCSTCLFACTPANQIKVNPDKESYLIGITQFVRHDSLDACTRGFKSEISKLLDKENRGYKFLDVNSQGEISLCTTAASALVTRGADIILANATPSFQAAINTTKNIPIVGNSITSYETAVGRVLSDDIIGTNATGVTDLAPLKEQAAMIFDLLPESRKIGLIYCSCEPNSIYQIRMIEQYLLEIAKERNIDSDPNFKVTRYPFIDSNEVEQISRKAALDSDVIYIPTDNTCAASALTINAAMQNGSKVTPIICGEASMCRKMGIATLSVDYEDLGRVSGQMAFEILLGKAKVNEMKIRCAENFVYQYNKSQCEACGINIDERFNKYEEL